MKSDNQTAVWRNHSNQWQKVGAPLRPSAQDGKLMMAAVKRALSNRAAAVNVAILGVTPEVVQLPWPSHACLQAFDHSAEMIASVWRAHPDIPSSVQEAPWQRLPLQNQSVRIVVGDGSLNVLPYLSDYRDVLAELGRVLQPDGRLCLRCFVRPEEQESLETVAVAGLAGEIQSFHALKWRVAMTLCEGPQFSVIVSDIHAAFESKFSDRRLLGQTAAWPLEVINTIDAYKRLMTRYTFPTLEALVNVCSPYFEMESVLYGNYELAERCPTVSFKPRGSMCYSVSSGLGWGSGLKDNNKRA